MKNNSYLLVAVLGLKEIEKWIDAASEKEACEKFWESLTEEQKDAVEEIDCCDVQY